MFILPSMLRIVVEHGGEVIDDVLFDKRVVSIGRELSNDVVLRDNRVSALHLVLKQIGEGPSFRLIEQGWNGTEVDGVRVSGEHVVGRPTVLRIADYEMTLMPIQARDGTVEVGRNDFERTSEHEPIPRGSVRQPPASRAQAEFRIIGPNGSDSVVEFSETALIGRTSDCDIRIDSSDVSRQHCQVYYTADGYQLRRLSTVNGVDVNGRPLAPAESCVLRSGDVVRICNFTLSLHVPPRAPRDGDVVDASPNLDLAVHRRPSLVGTAVTFEVVGFLGTKTFAKFEREIVETVRINRDVIIDFGYLVGLDASGIASLSRIFLEASRCRVVARLIRCSPRVVDLFHSSSIGHEILPHVSRNEESAVRSMRR